MPKFRVRHAFVAVLLLVSMLAQGTWALAGTTGGISGTVVDATTGRAVADATVTASSPSGGGTATTNSAGNFNFLTLAPDTYTISATKTGYNSASQSGVTVFADQTHTLTLAIQPALRTIANVTARAAGNLVKSGTTADIYSVNAATQQVVAGSGGGFNLNQAYSGIYSQPGVTSYIGNAGWGQVFYIRGSAYSQIGYEFDGVPVNRAFDNYQANSLSSLGQQELQVYTGGSPSGASSATLGGFINQVIKTGTYPGFGTLKGGIGSPGFYHALTAEAGGSNPNRTFSYYVGVQGYNQHFPYGTWGNMSGIAPDGLNSYGLMNGSGELASSVGALACVTNTGCADGGSWNGEFLNGPFQPCQTSGADAGEPVGYTTANPGPFNGACFGFWPWNPVLSDIHERDNVINLHFAIPHHNDSGRDDIQLLYDNSMQYQLYGDSMTDAGGLGFMNSMLAPFATSTACFGPGTGCGDFTATGLPYTGPARAVCGYENLLGLGCAAINSPIPYTDSMIFASGTSFGQSATTATAIPYYFPNTNSNRALNTPFSPTVGIEPNYKDGFWNDVGIVKGQYTKNIGSNAYARLFGYTFYSDWLINGPPAGGTCYFDGYLCYGSGPGWDGTADYELATHTRGAEFQFADQINQQNLLRFTANYTTAGVTRWNNTTFYNGFSSSRNVTNLTNGNPSNPVCYDYRPTLGTDPVTHLPIPNPNAGAVASCYSTSTSGSIFNTTHGQPANPCGAGLLPAGSAACAAGAQWLVTVPKGNGTFNSVQPIFTSMALEDEFKPNDKLDLNLGVRFENYQYNLQNLNNPEFNYWFNAEAQVVCYDPVTKQPMFEPLGLGQPVPPPLHQTAPLASCGNAPSGQPGLHPTGALPGCVSCGPLQYTAAGPSTFTHGLWSPRVGGTYTFSADDVVRFSAGKYSQPTETAFEQYSNESGKQAASFDFSRFFGLGYNTPAHDNPVQYSNNYDFSWEHRFHNSDVTFKLSPFYRDTHNEIVTLVLGPGFVSGVNLGHQISSGIEFQVQKGDPSRDGWAGALSYTYTNTKLQFGSPPSGINHIDYLNQYISAFNKLTSAGGGAACYYGGTTPVGVGTPGTAAPCPANFATAPYIVSNPYYNIAQQPLLDRNGWYPTYPNEPPTDPNLNATGQTAIWPHQFVGWVQYKHGRWAIAPNFTLIAGSYYGDPVDTYGIDPRACGQNETAAVTSSGAPVPGVAGTAAAGNCDFLTAGATGFTSSGLLAIPNPYTGSMDKMGQFQEPWQLNVGALLRYDVSPRVTANLTLTNVFNWCYGGSSTPWSSANKPNQWVCGYASTNGYSGGYIGPLQGQPGYGGGFFYGTSPTGASNGNPVYSSALNYPFAPYSSALPFQAYLEVQIKL
jgi:hypothetical protein